MLKKIFFYIAATGWVASLIIHLLTFAGYDVFEKISHAWMALLFLFIFVVWIPAMIYLIRSEEYQPLNPLFTLRSIYNRIPRWVTIGCVVCFIYTIVTLVFLQLFLTEGGTGTITRILSTCCLLFYGVAITILYPSQEQIENDL